MRYIIKEKECGYVIKNGRYISILVAGTYWYPSVLGYQIIKENMTNRLQMKEIPSEILLKDKEIADRVLHVVITDGFLGAIYKNGSLVELVESGEVIYWNVFDKYECQMIDMREPEMDIKHLKKLLAILPTKYYKKVEIQPGEIGLLYYDNHLVKNITGGTYYYWMYAQDVLVRIVDQKTKELEVTGQEILTKDRIAIRLNLICSYRITDPVKMVETMKGVENQIYSAFQLIAREYVGTYRLDELLEQREEIAQYMFRQMQKKQEAYCVEFLNGGIKDIILPGEIKDIMNTVLIAEKRAQANVITRREEVASTRSLLNTAKLMEENQTLYKLKEMEYLEKICNQVGNINVAGGENLLVQLGKIL